MTDDNMSALKQGTELFRKVYDKEISEETFYHKHFENPCALSIPYIIETKNEKPVAMRWLMKLNFRFNDKIIYGVQSSDDAVLDEARGLLFLKMRKKTLSILKQENIDFEYGCFYPGTAKEIAEKSGEKNVVDLYMARLFIGEKKHRWKRFDIPIPSAVRIPVKNTRINRLSKLAINDLEISVGKTCMFSDEDYKSINDSDGLFVVRNHDYYKWKTAREKDLIFVTARKNSRLSGYLIIKNEAGHATVVDWDSFGSNKVGVLASMFLQVCKNYEYIDIPSLNVENGEMKLFTDLGCKDMSGLWAPVCICAKATSEDIAPIIENPKNWKHRLIDADYFLNGE